MHDRTDAEIKVSGAMEKITEDAKRSQVKITVQSFTVYEDTDIVEGEEDHMTFATHEWVLARDWIWSKIEAGFMVRSWRHQ